MAQACRQANCTVAQTGICLLNNDPAKCPERLATGSPVDVSSSLASLPTPQTRPTFPPGLALSLAEAATLMGGRYCRIIGILGPPDAGKTAALVSLYLLLAHNKLRGYEFRDSLSLMGLEEISRGARRWNPSDPPGQLTVHTEGPDERAAGFIHLRVLKTASDESTDLFFSDLPGEWSNDLIDTNRTDRLSFLRSADVVWGMVDGSELASEKRQVVLHRTTLLLQRLAAMLSPTVPPVYLVISRRDKGELHERTFASLNSEAGRLKVKLRILHIASFSEDDTIAPGAGLAELLDAVIDTHVTASPFWPDTEVAHNRRVLAFRYRP